MLLERAYAMDRLPAKHRKYLRVVDDISTAYHEASHAVVGWACGINPLWIRLKPGRAEFGSWHRRVLEARAIIPDIETLLDIVVTLAGLEAEARLCPEMCFRKYNAMWARGVILFDHRHIKRLLAGYAQADIDALMPVLIFASAQLVAAHWPQIEILAEALVANGIVRRREIRRLLGRRRMRVCDVILMVAWLVAGARLAG